MAPTPVQDTKRNTRVAEVERTLTSLFDKDNAGNSAQINAASFVLVTAAKHTCSCFKIVETVLADKATKISIATTAKGAQRSENE